MNRRKVITLIATGAAWPFVARAQQRGAIARIGFLGASSESGTATRVEALRLGLRELGYIDGATINFEYRWADGQYERLPELAAELVRSNVDLIVTHGTPGGLAAKRASATIPIVVANSGDPVATGMVASLARPGGNITGLSFFAPELEAKRIELLKELMPQLSRAAVLLNAENPADMVGVKGIETTAQSLKVQLQQYPVHSPDEFENAFERMAEGGVQAVTVNDDLMLISNARAIAALAARHHLVVIGSEELAQAGGLMGYGASIIANFHRAAVFVDKILKGAKPADIPIEQSTKFEVVLNLKTARALGLDVPSIILVRADQVIE